MNKLVEEQVLVHPKHIGRLFIRNCDLLTVPAHPDEPLHKRRSPVWFTVWIPLDDCPTNLGPLQRLESLTDSVLSNRRTKISAFRDLAQKNWLNVNRSCHLRISMDRRFQEGWRPVDPSNPEYFWNPERLGGWHLPPGARLIRGIAGTECH